MPSPANVRKHCLLPDGSPDPSRFKRRRRRSLQNCDVCGGIFWAMRVARYCGDRCRQVNHREMLKRLGVDR